MKTARELQKQVNDYNKANLIRKSQKMTFEETCRVIRKAAKIGNSYALFDQMSNSTSASLVKLGYTVREIDTGYCSMPCYMVKWGMGMGSGELKDEFDDWGNDANFMKLTPEEEELLSNQALPDLDQN